jgi:hypothetical protein
MTTPNYILDETSIVRDGRIIRVRTLADISPEVVLKQSLVEHIETLRTGVRLEKAPLYYTWRKRLASVTED